MPKLFIAIWSCGTQSKQWDALQHASRLEILDSVVMRSFNQYQELVQDKPVGQKVSWIFLAPEYMFQVDSGTRAKGKGGGADRIQLGTTEKMMLKAKLYTLSARFGDLLLIPGSIAFRKPIKKPGEDSEKTLARKKKVSGRIDGSYSSDKLGAYRA